MKWRLLQTCLLLISVHFYSLWWFYFIRVSALDIAHQLIHPLHFHSSAPLSMKYPHGWRKSEEKSRNCWRFLFIFYGILRQRGCSEDCRKKLEWWMMSVSYRAQQIHFNLSVYPDYFCEEGALDSWVDFQKWLRRWDHKFLDCLQSFYDKLKL